MHVRHYTVYQVLIFLKAFVTELVINNQRDDQRCADTYSKPKDIDKRKHFVTPEAPEGCSEIVPEHNSWFNRFIKQLYKAAIKCFAYVNCSLNSIRTAVMEDRRFKN